MENKKRRTKKPDNVVQFDPRIRPAPRRVAEPKPEMLTQKDLVEYVMIQTEGLNLKEELDRKEKYIRDLLEKGVEVERGLHSVRVIPTLQIR